MAFRSPAEQTKAKRMTWDGTEARARKILDWARDGALLPYAAITPPDRNAPDGDPAAAWQLKILTVVDPLDGGGVVWVPVPVGGVITFTGTEVDPVFTTTTARQSAETFGA